MVEGIAPKMLTFLYSIVLPLIVGYVIKKVTNITKEKFDILIKIHIALFVPMTIILSFWNMKFSNEMLLLPIIGLFMPLIAAAVGYLMSMNRYDSSKKRGSFIVSCMLSNRLNIGGLSAYIIFGEPAYVFANFLLMFNAITTFAIAHPLGNYFGNRDRKNNRLTFKSIVFRITNIGILAIFIGIALNISVISRPEAMKNVIDKLIKVAVWIALLPIGASIEFSSIRTYYKDMPRIFLVKFLLLPFLSACLAIPFFADKVVIATVIILGISPVAINAVIVAKMNNLEEQLTVSAFLTTSAFYILIVFPLILLFTQYLIV